MIPLLGGMRERVRWYLIRMRLIFSTTGPISLWSFAVIILYKSRLFETAKRQSQLTRDGCCSRLHIFFCRLDEPTTIISNALVRFKNEHFMLLPYYIILLCVLLLTHHIISVQLELISLLFKTKLI